MRRGRRFLTGWRTLSLMLGLGFCFPSPAYSQTTHLEFAERPRLLECGGKPCFRLVLNAVDRNQRPVALDVDSREGLSVIRNEIQPERIFHFRLLEDGGSRTQAENYSLILVDISGSMLEVLPTTETTKFEAAKAAVREYIGRARESEDYIALVPFESHQVRDRIQTATFSSLRAELMSALESFPVPESKNNTALYSAIYDALDVLARKRELGAQVSLVVMTDGKNDVRPPPRDDEGLLGDAGLKIAEDKAQALGIQIITIGFGSRDAQNSFNESALRAIATSPTNYYYAADAARLQEVFRIAKEKLSNRFQITVGPVEEQLSSLTGTTFKYDVYLESEDGERLVTENHAIWSAPSMSSPSYEGRLDELESADFGQETVQIASSPWLRRFLIFVGYAFVLALLWFFLPALLWRPRRPEKDARSAAKPRKMIPESPAIRGAEERERKGGEAPGRRETPDDSEATLFMTSQESTISAFDKGGHLKEEGARASVLSEPSLDRFQRGRELRSDPKEPRKEPQSSAASPGNTIEKFFLQTPGSPASILPVFIRILESLEQMHASGKPHPSLRPSSIRVERSGQVRIPATTDPAGSAPDPKYSAPELFWEDGEEQEKVHEKTDIYVMGYLLYEALAGQELFSNEFEDFKSEFKWYQWHCSDSTSVTPLAELVEGFPAPLSQTVSSMIEKDPAKRPKSLSAVREDLEVNLRELTKLDAPTILAPSPLENKPLQRRRIWPFVMIVAIVLLLSGLLYWWFSDHEEVGSGAVSESLPSEVSDSGDQDFQGAEPGSGESRGAVGLASARSMALPRELPGFGGGGPMVLVPGGEFTMGCDQGRICERYGYQNEAPERRLRVPSFYIDKYEVTNAEFRSFCRETGRTLPPNPAWDGDYIQGKPNYPAVNLSWEDANLFCQWMGKRLPTEEEWEKAGRGDDGRRWPWGNEYLPGMANLAGSDDGFEFTAPVGAFVTDRSSSGALDMAGNVAEWVADEYQLYPGNPAVLPDEEKGLKVVRGGGALVDAFLARTSNRSSHAVSFGVVEEGRQRDRLVGARCVLDASVVEELLARPVDP